MNDRRNDKPKLVQPGSLVVALELVHSALRGLQFGSVTLIVQDGRIVQVDRFEKTRISET